MIRISLIVAALLSGHHHVTVTHANGAGYMTTSLVCTRPSPVSQLVLCRRFHIVVKARFVETQVQTRADVFHVRRAYVYNAAGRLSGWVDWRRAFQGPGLLVGTFRVNSGEGEVWRS